MACQLGHQDPNPLSIKKKTCERRIEDFHHDGYGLTSLITIIYNLHLKVSAEERVFKNHETKEDTT
jgi:hypothetical protein